MNAVSFCLYGQDPKYVVGAIRNACLMPSIYPEWEMHLWFDADVPLDAISQLTALRVKLHEMDGRFKQRMFYRLLIHDMAGVERYLIRDTDSRISLKEAAAVKQWIEAATVLHTIHDHPYHGRPVQGGLWGMWKERSVGPLPSMASLIEKSGLADIDKWGQDEEFLATYIWPLGRSSATQHGKVIPFPSDPDPNAFCGEILDENDTPNWKHRKMRRP